MPWPCHPLPTLGAVYCHALAHINVDECAAPEVANPGMKLIAVEGDAAKLTPDAIENTYPWKGLCSRRPAQRCLVTNLTEAGTAYNQSELATLGGFCRNQGPKLHLDGARLPMHWCPAIKPPRI